MELSGRLTGFPPSDLLQWAAQEQRSGALVVRRSSREKRVYFRRGKVVACLSDDPAEHYGEHLLLAGSLDERQLVRALNHCAGSGSHLGQALVDLEILPPDTVRRTLRDRNRDAVCDLFLWKRGVFYFESEMPPEGTAGDPIDALELILEGSRWIDEVARVRRVLVHDNVVLRRGSGWPPVEATARERRIAEAVGQGRTLADLYRRTRGSYFRFLISTFGLCFREVLDIAAVGEADPLDTAEMRIADLLLEQAGEEEREQLSRRRLGLPLDLLVRLHACWVQVPPEPERRELPTVLAELAAGLDGTRPLGDLLVAEPEARSQQLDFLQLELHRGRLALLPASPESLDFSGEGRGEPTGWWRRLFSRAG
jgi:hypothetical protein